MAKEYEVLQFKVGNFQDNFGNTWCDMALAGVSEPVRIVVKDPTTIKDGDKLYGEITEQTSKAGKPYLRFKRVQQDDTQQSFTPSAKPQWQPRDDSAIRAQWAINASLQYWAQKPFGEDAVPRSLKALEEDAKEFYAMVDRVKDSVVTGSTNPGETKSFTNADDAEFASLMSKQLDEGMPINLDEVPY